MLNVTEVAKLLGVNEIKVYEEVRARRIPSIRLGRRILIPRKELLTWIETEAMGGEVRGKVFRNDFRFRGRDWRTYKLLVPSIHTRP